MSISHRPIRIIRADNLKSIYFCVGYTYIWEGEERRATVEAPGYPAPAPRVAQARFTGDSRRESTHFPYTRRGARRCYGRLCLAFHSRSTNRDELASEPHLAARRLARADSGYCSSRFPHCTRSLLLSFILLPTFAFIRSARLPLTSSYPLLTFHAYYFRPSFTSHLPLVPALYYFSKLLIHSFNLSPNHSLNNNINNSQIKSKTEEHRISSFV